MKILLLAGTTEARALARALDARAGVSLTTSLAGATRGPAPLAGRLRRGGFGGGAAQAQYMQDQSFDAVIDATHPFAAAISPRTQAIAADLGLPYLNLTRPPWRPGAGDHWTQIPHKALLAPYVPGGAVLFLATGPKALSTMAPLPGTTAYCRRIDATDEVFPWPNGAWIVDRPPFAEEAEIALFQRLGITHLVTKNAGGSAGMAKLHAARALGMPVLMIERPPAPNGNSVPDVAGALAWVAAL